MKGPAPAPPSPVRVCSPRAISAGDARGRREVSRPPPPPAAMLAASILAVAMRNHYDSAQRLGAMAMKHGRSRASQFKVCSLG